MNSILKKTWLRVAAFLLFCLTAPAALFSAVGLGIAVSEDWYSQESSFATSFLSRRLVEDDLTQAYDAWPDLYEESPAFSYVIETQDGRTLTDTTAPGDVFITTNWYHMTPEMSEHLLENASKEASEPQEGGSAGLASSDPARAAEDPFSEPAGWEPGESDGSDWSYEPEDSGNWEDDYIVTRGYLRLPVTEASGARYWHAYRIYRALRNRTDAYLPLTAGLLAVSLLLFVFLMASAGRRQTGEDGPRGLGKIPFDLYTVGTVILLIPVIPLLAAVFSIETAVRSSSYLRAEAAALAGIVIYGCAVLLGWCVTVAARVRGRCLLRNTVIARLFRLIGKFFRILPSLWAAVLLAVGYLILNAIGAAVLFTGDDASVLAFFFLVLFNGAAGYFFLRYVRDLQRLEKQGQAIAAGDYLTRPDPSILYPRLRAHAENLAGVSAGMSRALDARMKSERMKTELITNVSHDLKTPLTSIVNYVGLLKQCDLPGEDAKEYVEVLDRQSQRLKKLTEDLVEASKASSGAIQMEFERLDLAEMTRQAAGEYAARLEAAQLTPVVSLPETPLPVRADSRYLWRVLDNLLSNAVKYAMPGSRVYIDAAGSGADTVLTVKNISAAPLNLSPEELTERFVRGDVSRSTEGSGLGLSIARSLTGLMGGRFALAVDGDLFKVTLSFPSLPPELPQPAVEPPAVPQDAGPGPVPEN